MVRSLSLSFLDGKAALAVDFFPGSSIITFGCIDGQVPSAFLLSFFVPGTQASARALKAH